MEWESHTTRDIFVVRSMLKLAGRIARSHSLLTSRLPIRDPTGELSVNRRVASFETGDSRSFWGGDAFQRPAGTCGDESCCSVAVVAKPLDAEDPEQDAN